MNMTRAQLQAILARNPALSIDENPPGPGLPSAFTQCHPLRSLDQGAKSQVASLERISIRFTSCRCRFLDSDNLVGGCKNLLDGLVASGLLPGDGPDQIQAEYCQKKIKHRREEATIVEIFYPEQLT